MTVFWVFSFLLVVVGVCFLLNLTPEQITNDMMKIISPKQTLRDKAQIAQGKKKSRKLTEELNNIQTAMIATGNGKKFTVVFTASIVLFVQGIVIAVLLGNPFLSPILGIACCLIPFLFVKNTTHYYEKHINLELETALSVITTAYIRTDDIITAVNESIIHLKPPIQGIFQGFLGDAKAISADNKIALAHLRAKINNDIFCEWCDTLIQCQDDSTMKDMLLPIVGKLSDVRIINNEMTTLLQSVRTEYYTMVCLVIGNIPLIYIINKDWFHTLVNTIPGKIVIAICALVIMITAWLMLKYTKPITYKR